MSYWHMKQEDLLSAQPLRNLLFCQELLILSVALCSQVFASIFVVHIVRPYEHRIGRMAVKNEVVSRELLLSRS